MSSQSIARGAPLRALAAAAVPLAPAARARGLRLQAAPAVLRGRHGNASHDPFGPAPSAIDRARPDAGARGVFLVDGLGHLRGPGVVPNRHDFVGAGTTTPITSHLALEGAVGTGRTRRTAAIRGARAA